MIHALGETLYRRLSILPDDWRKIGPPLCEGLDADFLLIDAGPFVRDDPRYTVVGLGSSDYRLHFYADLSEILAPHNEGGLGPKASLIVPLPHQRRRQAAHIGMLRLEGRPFTDENIVQLKAAARRLLSLLSAR